MKLEEAIFAGRLGFVEIQLHSLIHQTSTCEALVLDRIESLEAQCVVSRKQISSKTIDLNVAGSAMDSIEEVLELKCLANGSLRFRLNVRGWLPGSRNAQRFLLISERVNIETIALSSPSKANHAASQSQVQGFHHRLQPLFFETEDDEDLGNAVACQYCLELSFIYFPNHISFPFLAISTLTESRFPVEVCEQMRQLLMLSDQSVSSSLQSEDVVVVGSQIDRELLLQAIDRLILLHSDQQSQSPRKARTIPNSMQFSQSNQVDAVTAFSQTKSFLESFARTLSQAPAINYALVEHILTTFLQTLQCTGILAPSSSESNAPSSGTSYLASEGQMLSAHQLDALIMSSSLWYLQQTLLALNLAKEFQITFRELFAIFSVFITYDNTLSNEIYREDLQDLLQDLGGDYGAAETEFIAAKLDVECMGLIGFTEFLRWWCEDNAI